MDLFFICSLSQDLFKIKTKQNTPQVILRFSSFKVYRVESNLLSMVLQHPAPAILVSSPTQTFATCLPPSLANLLFLKPMGNLMLLNLHLFPVLSPPSSQSSF